MWHIDPWGLEILYRVVRRSSYRDYQDALNGSVRPRGGSASVLEHNNGNTASPFTSWTTNPDVATSFALREGGDGIVLMIDTDSGGFFQRLRRKLQRTESPDLHTTSLVHLDNVRVSESEVLMRGNVTGAEVSHVTLQNSTLSFNYR